MDTFLQALDAVATGLRSLPAERRARLHASTNALDRLRQAATALPTATTATTATGAPASPVDLADLADLATKASTCRLCPHLAESRTQVVFGVGNPHAELMFVGEAPGADEDAQGEPFVGKAGQLLTKIIEAMGYSRSDVYIANVLKCRPDMPPDSTGNRRPTAEEMQTCLPYLREQIRLIAPRAIVALGGVAMEGLLGEQRPMRDLRGRWLELDGIPVMATYHPAYLLRNPAITEKRKVWEDMLQVLERLEKEITPRQYRFFTQPPSR